MFDSFIEELTKIAKVELDQVREGTPITDSIAKLKKTIRPGDIFLTKTPKPAMDYLSRSTRIAQGGGPMSQWTHAGIVKDKNTIIHAYDRVEKDDKGKYTLDGEGAQVFEHKIDDFDAMGRDVMVLRPRSTSKEIKRAINRAEKMVGLDYNDMDLIRTLLPSKRRSIWEDRKKADKNGVICTTVPAMAYHRVKLHPKKSRMALKPLDIAKSKALDPVVAYSGSLENYERNEH